MKISYNWLQSYFDAEIPTPERVEEILSVRSFEPEGIEVVNGDSVLDFDVLPNRAHDALSHRGIARELSAVLGESLKTDRYRRRDVEKVSDVVDVDVQDVEKCRRYISRVIRGVKISETPNWLKDQLVAIGQKSINNVVDSTNYVMFDLGQPLHAFDMDKLSGGIVVRNAHEGEEIVTLTGEEKSLTNDDLVIADEESPLAVAGIKGGKKAEVDAGTVNIVLESANFNPLSTRQTSRRVGIQTDSSKRFENKPTCELALEAMERVTDLIVELCPDAKIGPVVDIYPNKEEKAEVSVSLEDINSVVGVEISKEKVSEIFDSLELPHTEDGEVFTVSVPDFRMDIRIKQDLIEEVARMYGFENIPATLPEGFYNPALNKIFYYSGVIRQLLVEQGFFEVYTYNFWDKGEVKTLNAIASDKGYLRPSLHRGMKESIEKNVNNRDLLGVEEINIFEIGTVFIECGEYVALGLGLTDIVHGNKKTKKDAVERLEKTLGLLSEKMGVDITKHQSLSEVDDSGVIEFNLSKLVEDLPEPIDDYSFSESGKAFVFKNFSLQPSISRDVSVWLPSRDSKPELEEILSGLELSVREPRMIDEFEKEGRVSYLYRLVFQADDRTLTDEEINAVMGPVYEEINSKGDWELR